MGRWRYCPRARTPCDGAAAGTAGAGVGTEDMAQCTQQPSACQRHVSVQASHAQRAARTRRRAPVSPHDSSVLSSSSSRPWKIKRNRRCSPCSTISTIWISSATASARSRRAHAGRRTHLGAQRSHGGATWNTNLVRNVVLRPHAHQYLLCRSPHVLHFHGHHGATRRCAKTRGGATRGTGCAALGRSTRVGKHACGGGEGRWLWPQ